MYSEIAANKRKTWLIMTVFLILIGVVAYVVSAYWFNSPSTTYAILVMAVIYAAITYYTGGKMAIGLNGGVEVTDTNNRLYRVVENLSITVGLPVPKIYLIEDPGLNAFATGRDPQHAMVAATTGLVNSLSDTELEGVMAHELGHIQNYDIRVSMVAFALVAVVAIISDIVMRSIWFGDNRDKGGGAIAIVGLVVVILAPIAAQLLKLAISRKREYLADATGALTTRYPEGLASALEKLGDGKAVLHKQNSSTAHLFIANPLKSGVVSGLFSTHPPIEERVARLRAMENKA